jgi:hypothetical protein
VPHDSEGERLRFHLLPAQVNWVASQQEIRQKCSEGRQT